MESSTKQSLKQLLGPPCIILTNSIAYAGSEQELSPFHFEKVAAAMTL